MNGKIQIINTGSKTVHILQKTFDGETVGGTTTYLEPGQTVEYELSPETSTVAGVLVPRGNPGDGQE